MTLNPRIWYPIAVIGSLVNVAGAAVAASMGEPWHAGLHAGLAVAAGVWAQHLRLRWRAGGHRENEAEIGALRDEIDSLRGELGELQERLDFVERVLGQTRDMDRLPGRQPNE
jgi:hypothetical protein